MQAGRLYRHILSSTLPSSGRHPRLSWCWQWLVGRSMERLDWHNGSSESDPRASPWMLWSWRNDCTHRRNKYDHQGKPEVVEFLLPYGRAGDTGIDCGDNVVLV